MRINLKNTYKQKTVIPCWREHVIYLRALRGECSIFIAFYIKFA